MKFKTFAMLLAWSSQTFAQIPVDNICMQVLGCTGLYAEANGQHYAATMGESMIATLTATNGTFVLTQGFHQPECTKTGVGTEGLANQWQLSIFPNPTSSALSIRYLHPQGKILESRVWNIAGILVSDWQSLDTDSVLDCNSFAAGVYLLELRDPTIGQRTTIRFIKSTF